LGFGDDVAAAASAMMVARRHGLIAGSLSELATGSSTKDRKICSTVSGPHSILFLSDGDTEPTISRVL